MYGGINLTSNKDLDPKPLNLPVKCEVVKVSPEMKKETEAKEAADALQAKLNLDNNYKVFYQMDSS